MAVETKCPHCGKPVPPTALEGICPECLLKAGLTDTGEVGPDGTVVMKSPPPLVPLVSDLAPHFPQLEIIECLGRGGMGAVYKARQPKLDRFVALKILSRKRDHGTPDAEFAQRFEREARALARLSHPDIVAVYDFGETGGFPYLLMEYVDGVTLRHLLQTRKLAPEEALAIVPKICEALQFAHERGIVHRDIKPENILLDKQGRVKIADFGIAKIIAGSPLTPSEEERVAGRPREGNLTQNQVIGTPHYMAPEQVEKPATVDHRADIYSLGVVFYEMLTGELPLGKFASPSKKVQVDVRLDEVVLHALEKEPDRRYQHASEVKTDVETIVADTAARNAEPSASSNRRQVRKTPADERRREALLWYGFFASLIGLPVGLDLGLPFVWGLSVAGLVICVVKLGFLRKLFARRKPPGEAASGPPLSALEFWMAMDRENYAQAWETAAPLFQRTASKTEWVKQMERVRRPLGPAQSRKLCSMKSAPDRSVLDAIYETSFASQMTAVESVSFAAQPDGAYKVIRYQVEPGRSESSAESITLSPAIPWVAPVRWTARILGTLLLLFFGVFIVAEGLPPIASQPEGVQLNFVALGLMLAGFAVGWKRDGAAALLIASGWALWQISEGRLEWNLSQTPLPIAALYAFCWWATHGRRTAVVALTTVMLALAFGLGGLFVPTSVFVRGHVVDAHTGQPLRNVELRLRPRPQRADKGDNPNTRSDADGRYRLYVGWYAADRQITLSADGYTALTTNLGPRALGARQVSRDYQLQRATSAAVAPKVPPVVIRTIPESGTSDVDPALTELRVTFSKPMRDGSWSWTTWGEENYPELAGPPRFLADGKTCVLPVKLQPGKLYATWLNSEHHHDFTDAKGQPAVPYLLIFETRK